MSKYIWINPVAVKMYGEDIDKIKAHLMDNGYMLADCDSQMDYVRNQYADYSKNTDEIILDCRCPETIELLKREDLLDGFDVPSIEPILVRTSRVMYDKYVKENDDVLIITCPCTQLRDYTKKRLEGCKNILVYTWKDFAESEGMISLGKIKESPIPLGFFRDSFSKVLELSSKDEIIEEIKNIKKTNCKKYDIVEMLYCKDGCNNGDGL